MHAANDINPLPFLAKISQFTNRKHGIILIRNDMSNKLKLLNLKGKKSFDFLRSGPIIIKN